jgi:hypothetical protein
MSSRAKPSVLGCMVLRSARLVNPERDTPGAVFERSSPLSILQSLAHQSGLPVMIDLLQKLCHLTSELQHPMPLGHPEHMVNRLVHPAD